ncbi:hypothetical protein [Arthrobacter bambusae]|uniref:hypothetical protein n=1 Tax=Arthrobacter bambusae TaxID=1338426 RepID=UPI002789376C|nr:hypothetical protein [Arthrobacter bambusae]MDQ0028791.1 hypothetical protein [Arthrobacter bambusae]MDQ0096415.1 hypothetical protein [Arthrobacter bambusae]
MAVEKLEPAPRTWMEKTYDLAGIFVSLLIVVIVTIPWQALRTSPLYLSALFPAAFVVYLVIGLLVSPLKKRRVAQNLDRGMVECSLRPGPKSLPSGYSPPAPADKRGWITGCATVRGGALIFQPVAAFTGTPVGESLSLPNIESLTGGLRTPATPPWYLGRGRRDHTVVYLKTETGVLEVAGSATGLKSVGLYPTEETRRA